MAYTAEQQKRIDYLRGSVRLQAPETETDPVYVFSDDDLYAILETVTPVHAPSYTIDDLPASEFYFIVLLAKKEIFYRLATSTAPFYPLSAEGAKLEKNVRFDHYLALIKVIMDEYESLTENAGGADDDGGIGSGTVETYQAKLWGKPYVKRYFELTDNPLVDLELSSITANSVNLDWTKYDSTHGNNFLAYKVYIGTTPVYDEYSPEPMAKSTKAKFIISDIRRTKLRLDNLLPNTTYYALVTVESRLGLIGYAQQEFKTKEEVTADATI